MKKTILILLVTLLGCESPSVILPKHIDTVKKSTTVLPINGFYYYTGEYWIDCAGVTRQNVIFKSEVPISKEWTRESVAGGYLKVSGASSDTSFNYISDDTQNDYCGY